jgi:hypothetical protein
LYIWAGKSAGNYRQEEGAQWTQQPALHLTCEPSSQLTDSILHSFPHKLQGTRKVLLWDHIKDQPKFEFVKEKVVHLVLDDAEAFPDPRAMFICETLQETVRWRRKRMKEERRERASEREVVEKGRQRWRDEKWRVQLTRDVLVDRNAGRHTSTPIFPPFTHPSPSFLPSFPHSLPPSPPSLRLPSNSTRRLLPRALNGHGQEGCGGCMDEITNCKTLNF